MTAGTLRRAGIVFPRHARAEARDRVLLRIAEAVERAGAIRELGGGDVGAQLRAILLAGRALHPFERHAASILGHVRQLSIACAIAIAAAQTPARAEGIGVVAASTGDRAAVGKAMAGARAEARAPRVVDGAVAGARAAIVAGAVPAATLERFRR